MTGNSRTDPSLPPGPAAPGGLPQAGLIGTLRARLRDHSAFGLGIAAQLLQYGSGLILLPFIVTRLPAAEVGVWYIFITLQGLVALADFGFQPTFSRSFSSAYAGAERIAREGHAPTGGAANLPLVRDLLRLCRRFYGVLALVVIGLLAATGVFYLPVVIRGEGIAAGDVQVAWAVLSAGTALMIYFSWNNGFLFGAGRVSSTYWGQIASRVGFIVIGGGALLAGWGLIGLAMGNLASVIMARIILQWRMAPLLRALRTVSSSGHARDANGTDELFAAIWPNAARMGLVAIGAFCITRLNVLVASSFFSLEVAASYAITLQLMSAVNSVAQLPIGIAVPQMVRLRVTDQFDALRSMWLARQAMLLGLFLTGVLFIAFVAEPLLAFVGSNVQLLPLPLIALLGLVALLEANHSACAMVITTGNMVPFVASALLSGLAVAVLSIWSASAGVGIAGLILAQGIVQLAYNNWKWPLELWRELH